MIIGIDASRAFLKKRTGIEEYSYQMIRHLRENLAQDEVILYVRKKIILESGRLKFQLQQIDFEIPENWKVKGLWAPRFWTQIRLSLEMWLHPVDTLFIPAHTVPLVHPENTVVTIHGLEYEFSPKSYSWYERWYMRFSIRNSVRWAKKVISVSENTKRDLIRLYQVPEEKIVVIYEGVGEYSVSSIQYQVPNTKYPIPNTPYFLFIGRVEERKNVARIIKAFDSFKQKTGLPHKLILAGKPGYGYGEIQLKIQNSKFKDQIQELGYVGEEQKWRLLKGAEALLFPSLYEGFGLPILEAQTIGIPVITSTTSSLPEIAGEGALLVDPLDVQAIAQALERLTTDPELRAGIIDKATQNVDRFSWARCAQGVASLLR